MAPLILFLNLFQVNYYLSLCSWIIYIVTFYLGILVVCLTIIDIIYVSYAISKKKFSFLWPIRALRSVCGLFVTALFLPLLELFFTILQCQDNGKGVMVNLTAPDIVCWQGMHILYAASAIIVSSIFIVISVFVAMTACDVSWDDENPSSRTSSECEVLQIYNKIIWNFVFSFFIDPEYDWLGIIVLLITSSLWFYNLMEKRPFINHIMSMTWCLVAAVFTWTNYTLCLNKLLDFSRFAGGVELTFLTYPLIVVIVLFNSNPLEKKLMTQFKNLGSGYDCYDHIRYFVHLASHDTVENRISLEGYINKYNEEEKEDTSLLRFNQSFVATQIGDGREKNEKALQKQLKVNKERKLMEHAFHLFKKGLEKFPKCTFLRIQYALFLLEKMKNKNWALKQLMKAGKKNPPLDEQFLIYRFK